MDATVADKFKSRGEKLVALVSQVELGLVSIDAMEGQLAELSPALFLDSSVFARYVALDGDVVLEVLANDAWRYLPDDALEGDIGLQSWLEVLNDAGLPDLEPSQVNDCQARV